MNKSLMLLIFIIFNICMPITAFAQYSSAKIYHLGWQVLTRVQASEGYVRKNRQILIGLNSRAVTNRFYRVIKKMPCSENRNPETLNTRIVIDFYAGDMLKTFQGDLLGLNIDGKLCRYTPEFFSEVNFLKFPK